MVKLCFETIKAADEKVTFGISPFGIWKNASSDPEGSKTAGLEAYFSLYCDALSWVRGGYVDYLAPQIYWEEGNSAADFEILSRWWNDKLMGSGVKLVISHGAYRVGEFTRGGQEIATQVISGRKFASSDGSIQYGYSEIKNNTEGVKDALIQVFSETVTEEENP